MLKPVFDKLGLDAEGLQQRLHFLDWTAADGDRLRRVGPFGRRLSNDFVDALYQRLGQYPENPRHSARRRAGRASQAQPAGLLRPPVQRHP
ncbi:protoglobin domain-containing protein [Halopseudomonas pachastrellae]|nr:protoglobin domain-containing protein [Halopseudomonas pachastrellae]